MWENKMLNNYQHLVDHCEEILIKTDIQYLMSNHQFYSKHILSICSQWVNGIFSLMLRSEWSNHDDISDMWFHFDKYFLRILIRFVSKLSRNGTQALAIIDIFNACAIDAAPHHQWMAGPMHLMPHYITSEWPAPCHWCRTTSPVNGRPHATDAAPHKQCLRD